MVLKLRDDVPLVWRSPTSLQFGVDAPLAVLQGLSAGAERAVAALVSGISESGFEMTARSVGLSDDEARALLATLEPALEREEAPAASRVAVSGTGQLADELRRALDAEGVLIDARPDASAHPSRSPSIDGDPTLAVIVAGWLVGAEDHGTWLRRDIPHVPLVIGETAVTLGPFIEPGAGPCLYCVQLSQMDADPAWPAIATQLWSRPALQLTPLALAEATAFAARRILQRMEAGVSDARSWRLSTRDGRISQRRWTRHAACRCATPAESDWAPVPDRATRSVTRRAAVDAVLA